MSKGDIYYCHRCRQHWKARREEEPLRCGKAGCQSPYWDSEAKLRTKTEKIAAELVKHTEKVARMTKGKETIH